MNLFVKAFCVLLLTGLAACGEHTIGKDFDAKLAHAFAPGVTTTDQAIAALGEPQKVEKIKKGSRVTWRYSKGSGGFGHQKTKVLSIFFDHDSKFIKIDEESYR